MMSEAAQNRPPERPQKNELTSAQAESRIAGIRQEWGRRFEEARENPNNVGISPQKLIKFGWDRYFSDLAQMPGTTAKLEQEAVCQGWAEALHVLSRDPNNEAVAQTRRLFGVVDNHIPTNQDLINYTSGHFPNPNIRPKETPAPEPPQEPEAKPGPEQAVVADVGEPDEEQGEEDEGDLAKLLKEAFAKAGKEVPTAKRKAAEKSDPYAGKTAEEWLKEQEEKRAVEDTAARAKVEAEIKERKRRAQEKVPPPSTYRSAQAEVDAVKATAEARQVKEATAKAERAARETEANRKKPGWENQAKVFWSGVWATVGLESSAASRQERGLWGKIFGEVEVPRKQEAPEVERNQALMKGLERIIQVANSRDYEAARLTVEVDVLVTNIAHPKNGASRLGVEGLKSYFYSHEQDAINLLRSKSRDEIRTTKRNVARATHPDILRGAHNEKAIGSFGPWLIGATRQAE